MIWWLLLFGSILAIVPVLWLAGLRRRKGGQTDMVLIGAAAGEAEMHTWVSALRVAGVRSHVINVGDAIVGEFGRSLATYGYEVWVPARDEARARWALGFERKRPES